jgi:hypothetical protein
MMKLVSVEWFYHTFLYDYFYPDSILVIRHPDDGYRSGRNKLVKINSVILIEEIAVCVLTIKQTAYYVNSTIDQ